MAVDSEDRLHHCPNGRPFSGTGSETTGVRRSSGIFQGFKKYQEDKDINELPEIHLLLKLRSRSEALCLQCSDGLGLQGWK